MHALRSGETAKIIGVEWSYKHFRPVYRIEYIDGKQDIVPVYEDSNSYIITVADDPTLYVPGLQEYARGHRDGLADK